MDIHKEGRIPAPSPPFRPGTQISQTKVAIAYNAGGIGDYIHWTPGIRYAVDSNPHIYGRFLIPHYFEDLARLWLKGYEDRFTFVVYDTSKGSLQLDELPGMENYVLVAPNKLQAANATGFHLFNLGFTYYAQTSFIPPDRIELPRIEGDEADISRFSLPSSYGVIQASATADNRKLSAKAINGLMKEMNAKGIRPVLLGKTAITGGYEAHSPDGIVETRAIDLRNKTSLVEAACIMAGAQFTIGIDGGLLHLASCTKAPVVFFFTSVDPALRVPPRRPDTQTIVAGPPPELACRYCNSKMRYIINHDFKHCLYRDNACATMIDSDTLIKTLQKANLL